MTQYQVAHVDGFRVYATEFGIDRTYIGAPFSKPRDAIAYSDELDAAATGAAQGGSEAPGDDANGGSRSEPTFTGALWPSEGEAGL